MGMFEDTKARLIRKHGQATFDDANEECAELVPKILALLTGHSNLAAGNAMVVLAAAVARADGVPVEMLTLGLHEAYHSPIVASLAASLRAAMTERGRA